MSIASQTYSKPTFKVGLGGNYYIICDIEQELHEVCEVIQKSTKSVYYSKKFKCFAVRVKSKKHKKILKAAFTEQFTLSD